MANDIVFDRAFDAVPGRPDEVAPGVRRVLAPNPGPFTFTGTCSYIVGHRDVVLIDPGPRDDQHIAALTAALGGARVSHIVLTHSHLDHVGGLSAVKAMTGAPVVGALRSGARRVEGPALDAEAEAGFAPEVVIEHGGRIEADGFVLEAVATPGHASDHLAFALAGTGVLFSGDHVMGWSTTVVAPPDGDMADYMASLHRLRDREERLYLPGHGAAITDGPVLVDALIRHREARAAAIRAAVEAGAASVEGIVGMVYAGLDHRLRAAAGLSVLAHLEQLVAQGLVLTEGAPRLDGTFRPA